MTLTPLAILSVASASVATVTMAAVTTAAALGMMTTEQIILLSIAGTTAGTTLIAAIGVVIVNIIMAKKVEKVSATADEIKTKAEVIVGHVNSEKTAAEGRQAKLEAENVLLRQIIAEKKETAVLLAQATASAPRPLSEPGLTDPPKPLEMEIVNTPEDPANVKDASK